MIKTPVVEIYGSDNSSFAITDTYLGMDKARCVLIYLNAGISEFAVVRFSKSVGKLLVRDSRQNESYIHTSLSRVLERCQKLAIQNKVGRHKVYIVCCPV